MKVADLQTGLERVVVGDSGGLEVEHVVIGQAQCRERADSGGGIGLVEIGKAEKLAAGRSDVGYRDGGLGRQLLFDIQIVVLHIRSAQTLIDGKNIGGTEAAVDRPGTQTASGHGNGSRGSASNRLQGIRVHAAVGDGPGTDVIEQGTGVARGIWNLTGEEVLGEGIISESVSGANNRLSRAKYVISNAHTRGEVVVVLRVQAAGATAHAHLHYVVG